MEIQDERVLVEIMDEQVVCFAGKWKTTHLVNFLSLS